MRTATPVPVTSSALSPVAVWFFRVWFEQANAWRTDGWTGRKPVLHALAVALLCFVSLGLSACVAEVRAEEHAHVCQRISDVPSFARCCRGRENGKCVLWGEMACYSLGCECGHSCGSSCTGCL